MAQSIFSGIIPMRFCEFAKLHGLPTFSIWRPIRLDLSDGLHDVR